MAGETKALIADTEQTILETVRVIEAVEQETRLVETQNTTLAGESPGSSHILTALYCAHITSTCYDREHHGA